MALENNDSNMVMPVAPYNFGGNGGFGGYDNGIFWIVILFLLIFNGGWNNNNFGGSNNEAGYIVSDVQRTADQSAVMNGITGISNTLADAEIARCNMQANLTSQITNAAMGAQINQAATQASIADLRSVVQTEACADRQSVNDALRDVIDSNNAGVQRILDQMNADKLDEKNTEIANLRQQLNMIDLANSQNQQTSQIINALQTPVPIPAYTVPAPFGCNGSCGYNCNYSV